MKYQRTNNSFRAKNNNLITDDFDTSEYLDEEFLEDSKRRFMKRSRKQEYEYIIDEDESDIPKEEKKTSKKESKKEEVKEETKLTIEPIRTVTKEEYKDITKKRQEEKEKQLMLEQEKYEKKKKKGKKKSNKKEAFKLKPKMVINTIFLIIIILIVMVVVDVVSVSKYEKGPYFAIKTSTLNDGGTKIYHGIGYKVIKYNQLQGRRDMVIGSWSLKYDIEPITVNDIDLAIKFNDNEEKTYSDLYKKFVRINSTLKSVNKKANSITIGYEDEDGKYTMDVVCRMANKDGKIYDLEVGKETTIIGTVYKLNSKTSTRPTTLKIDNCFAEQ